MASTLSGKVVIITGASSGIGAGTAVRLSKNGNFLAIVGRDNTRLEEVSHNCIAAGSSADKVLCIIADVTKVADCERIITETINKFGKLDVLVNNAGSLVSGGIENLSIEDYDRQMDVNSRSVFVMTKFAVPHLIKTKGNIVNVSSVTGLRAFPGVLAYCVSKAAVDQLTRVVALELADRQVRVNAINPGVIKTEIHKRAGMTEEQYNEFTIKSKTTHALGRVGTVEECAASIEFLASDAASFITGVTLPVDGGRAVMCPR